MPLAPTVLASLAALDHRDNPAPDYAAVAATWNNVGLGLPRGETAPAAVAVSDGTVLLSQAECFERALNESGGRCAASLLNLAWAYVDEAALAAGRPLHPPLAEASDSDGDGGADRSVLDAALATFDEVVTEMIEARPCDSAAAVTAACLRGRSLMLFGCPSLETCTAVLGSVPDPAASVLLHTAVAAGPGVHGGVLWGLVAALLGPQPVAVGPFGAVDRTRAAAHAVLATPTLPDATLWVGLGAAILEQQGPAHGQGTRPFDLAGVADGLEGHGPGPLSALPVTARACFAKALDMDTRGTSAVLGLGRCLWAEGPQATTDVAQLAAVVDTQLASPEAAAARGIVDGAYSVRPRLGPVGAGGSAAATRPRSPSALGPVTAADCYALAWVREPAAVLLQPVVLSPQPVTTAAHPSGDVALLGCFPAALRLREARDPVVRHAAWLRILEADPAAAGVTGPQAAAAALEARPSPDGWAGLALALAETESAAVPVATVAHLGEAWDARGAALEALRDERCCAAAWAALALHLRVHGGVVSVAGVADDITPDECARLAARVEPESYAAWRGQEACLTTTAIGTSVSLWDDPGQAVPGFAQALPEAEWARLGAERFPWSAFFAAKAAKHGDAQSGADAEMTARSMLAARPFHLASWRALTARARTSGVEAATAALLEQLLRKDPGTLTTALGVATAWAEAALALDLANASVADGAEHTFLPHPAAPSASPSPVPRRYSRPAWAALAQVMLADPDAGSRPVGVRGVEGRLAVQDVELLARK